MSPLLPLCNRRRPLAAQENSIEMKMAVLLGAILTLFDASLLVDRNLLPSAEGYSGEVEEGLSLRLTTLELRIPFFCT